MRKTITFIVLAVILAGACTKDRMPTLVELDNQLRRLVTAASPDGTMDYYILPHEEDYDNIPQDPLNPLSREKVELGKSMFFDTGLAMDAIKPEGIGTYSCASCHIPEAGFRPGNFQGIADGGLAFGINGENRVRNIAYDESELDVQSARPLTLVNVAFVENTFWNGQFGSTGVNVGTEAMWGEFDHATELNHLGLQGIETQNIEGLAVHRITINKDLLDSLGYTPLFDEAFPEIPEEDRYNRMTASLAFSAYIRSILGNQAPFQHWLKGNNDAMTYEEKRGGILFFSKAKCFTCHYQPNLGSLEFHALGVKDMFQSPSYNTSADDLRNLGRAGFTGRDEDLYAFRVPGIYNMEGTPFYFHGASARSLEEVVEYKAQAVSENPNVPNELLSEKFTKLYLTDEEKAHLVAFLRNGLRDPNLSRYAPSTVVSGNCFPNADHQSMIDLGCN